MTAQKRKKIEDLIYQTYLIMDPSGTNTDHYKNIFKSMSDAKFEQYIKGVLNNEDEYFIFHTVDYENDLRIENVEKAAEHLGVPLFEYVNMPYVNNNKENPIKTRHPVPVGYLHIKPMEQFRIKKNSASTEITTRSALTNQVVGKDKAGRESDQENFILTTLNAVDCMRELNGPRSDDMVMKNAMYNDIIQKGYVSLNTLPDHLENKTTLNTVNVHLIGMGLNSDLVKPL
ncbi:MAG: hypothetical protein PHF63_00265 [Herbinix sp.]|nr:hypothetical protein [Herbinix sp.]